MNIHDLVDVADIGKILPPGHYEHRSDDAPLPESRFLDRTVFIRTFGSPDWADAGLLLSLEPETYEKTDDGLTPMTAGFLFRRDGYNAMVLAVPENYAAMPIDIVFRFGNVICEMRGWVRSRITELPRKSGLKQLARFDTADTPKYWLMSN